MSLILIQNLASVPRWDEFVSLVYTKSVPGGNSPHSYAAVLAENLIRPIGTLFGVANGSGILPMGTGTDWFVG